MPVRVLYERTNGRASDRRDDRGENAIRARAAPKVDAF